MNLYETLLSKINNGHQCVILTYLDLSSNDRGKVTKKIILTDEDIEKKSSPIGDDLYTNIQLSLDSGNLQTIHMEDKQTILIEPFFPNPRLIIFGGGHISKPLCEFASKVGFATTVVDDRLFFANESRFPEAENIICDSFENSFKTLKFRKSDFVVVITRGHRYDGVILREILNYDLNYMGMIGSKRRVNGMKEELIGEGFSKDRLDSLYSPIGLDIHAITPDEIAISIVSQLISVKNKRLLDKFGKGFRLPDFDMDVIEEVSSISEIPKALVTILSSKGSVPRKAGAKMIAYMDGRTIGSIGGGCSEAGVISTAREIMSTGGIAIEHVDMTGDVAESEGMVCGGVMDVLIEIL